MGENAFFQQEWGRLEEIIERFEDSWQRGQPPAIEDYLRADDVEPRRLLVELVHADLECRLKAGEGVRVETYLERYPDLAADRRAALDLIEAEYKQRRRREPGLAADEYLQRFPEYQADLSARLPRPSPRLQCPHCHHALPAGASAAGQDVTCSACGSRFHLDAVQPPAGSKSGPARLGQFELLEIVGQGSFGTVYRARDVELGRVVAVKVPRGDRAATPADLDRFVREARNAAQLSHPGIVPVYEVGHDAAVPYIVSAYVEGVTLAETLAGRRLDFRQAAEVLAQVAEALDHAHRHGVIHRDLKPSNIMLGSVVGSGQWPVASKDKEANASSLATSHWPLPTAFLMDFGLARREDGEVRMTVEGQVLGTPAYMSPEQARGQGHRVDGRSDLYGLGVILYELLTGELPFRGTVRMMLQQILDDEPRPPRRLNDKVPRDLETIALKCLAKEPGRRYATAGDLAADLRRYLDGVPILARPVGPLERGWRWAKRNPKVAGLSAVVAGLLVVVAVGATVAALVIRSQRDAEIKARAEAEASAEAARRHLELTLDTLGKLVYGVQEELRDQPALLGLKEQLLNDAVAGLQRVAEITQGADADPHLVAAHQRLGDIFLQLGRVPEARQQYEHCRALALRLAAADPQRARAERAVCVATARLGEVSLRQHETQQARAYCQEAVRMALALAEADPESAQARIDLARCYNRQGNAEAQAGEPKAAAASYGQAAEQARRAAEIDPQSAEAKQELATSYENLGDARLQLKDLPAAREAHDQAMGLHAALAAAQPKSARAKRNLSIAYEKLGDLALRAGDGKAALAAYGQAQAQRAQLAAAAPKDSLAQRDLAVAHGKLGEAYEFLRDLPSARAQYEKARGPLEGLAEAYPGDGQCVRDRAVAYLKLAALNQRLGDRAPAREYRGKALADFGQLAADAQNVQAQFDLVFCCLTFGLAEAQARDFALAGKHFERGVTVLRALEAQGKLKDRPLQQQWLRDQQQRLAFCKAAERAITDLDFALAQPPAEARRLLRARAGVLADRGQHTDAAATAEKLRGLNPDDAAVLYDVACCYALAAAGARPEESARPRYIAAALGALAAAVERGYQNVAQMEAEPDLAAAREAEAFRDLVARLKASGGR